MTHNPLDAAPLSDAQLQLLKDIQAGIPIEIKPVKTGKEEE